MPILIEKSKLKKKRHPSDLANKLKCGLNCVPPQNSYIEALTPSMMVFGDRIFGR